MSEPAVRPIIAPDPILATLNSLGVCRLSADGSALIRPDGTVFAQVVATPIPDVPPGTYLPSQEVALTSATEGAIIYFTTDGSAPTKDSEVYAEPFFFEEDTVLSYFASAAGMIDSRIVTIQYVIVNGSVADVDFDPQGGVVPLTLTLSCTTPGSAIHYTQDGSPVTLASPLYTVPLDIETVMTVAAVAFRANFHPSSPVSYEFTLTG